MVTSEAGVGVCALAVRDDGGRLCRLGGVQCGAIVGAAAKVSAAVEVEGEGVAADEVSGERVRLVLAGVVAGDCVRLGVGTQRAVNWLLVEQRRSRAGWQCRTPEEGVGPQGESGRHGSAGSLVGC